MFRFAGRKVQNKRSCSETYKTNEKQRNAEKHENSPLFGGKMMNEKGLGDHKTFETKALKSQWIRG